MIAFTGGKTGGHILPLIALSEVFDNCIYVGGKNLLEEKICKAKNIKFYGLDIKDNKISSILKSAKKIRLPKINAIISTGGFISAPLLIYGIRKRIPIYLIEANTRFGLSNSIFCPFAKKIFLAYDLGKKSQKYVVSGLPTNTIKLDYKEYEKYNFDILIIGSSLGSKPLCELTYLLKNRYKIGLIAGKYAKEFQNIPNVTCFEFVNNLPNLMLHSKIIISRAGASTTNEIFSIGKPCIIIPSLKTKFNHQVYNAKYFENKKCCIILDESECKDKIEAKIEYILNNDFYTINMINAQKKLIKKDSINIIKNNIKER